MSFASEVETMHIEENKSNISNISNPMDASEIRSSIEQKLLDHLFHNELQLFRLSLESIKDPEINIVPIHDKKNYNVLHVVALNNQNEMAIYLYEYAKKMLQNNNSSNNLDSQRILHEWTNEKTDEGFTPLHLAAFRGNLKIIDLFVSYGADITLKNKQGLNCLHIAAQGDQAASLTYFKSKGLDINETDLKGSTPLHWASYLGCENAVSFILSWKPKLDLKDEEGGLTPLHLAVISGNSRVVRKLLIKGSNRHVKDKNFKIAADLAKENDYINILGMLEENNGFQQFYNIKTSFKPSDKKLTSLLGFFGFFFVFNPLIILFTFPYIKEVNWIIFFSIFLVSSLFFFIAVWLKDPGYLYMRKDETLLKLLEKGTDSSAICPECEIIKPLRSRHCDVCRRCVGVYDHHCPWINNCVGMRNHRYFICFITSVWIYLIVTILMILINIGYNDISGTYLDNWADINRTNFFIAKLICDIISLCFAIFFFIPLSILVYIQMNNFLLNKTTAERYGHNQQKIDTNSNRLSNSNDFNQSLLEISKSEIRMSSRTRSQSMKKGGFRYFKNCYAMCCGNEHNLTSEQSWLLKS